MPEKMTDRIIASAHFIAEFVEEKRKPGWIFHAIDPAHWDIFTILSTTEQRMRVITPWRSETESDAFAVMAAFEKALLFEPNGIAMVPAK